MSSTVTELQEENKKLRDEIARKDQEIELLTQKVDLLVKKLFGAKAEKLDLDQLLLFDSTKAKKPGGDGPAPEDEPSPQKKSPRKKRTPREATLPDDLPVEETILIPDEVQAHPENYRQISEEITTKLDYQPARFKKLITRRPRYAKRLRALGEPEELHISELPPSLKERSLLTPRLAAEIATSRYCNHQPYHRQEQHFLTRHGVHLPRNTLSQWMGDLAHLYLTGIYDALHTDMLTGDYLQADETPINYLQPGSGKTQKGYLWTISRPALKTQNGRGDILYQWHPTRATTALQDLLQKRKNSFLGTLQCDGYQAYETYQSQHPEEIELIGCWAHVRRKFYEAREQQPKLSGWFLKQIRNLYAIEAKLRQQRAGPRERERVRSHQSLPIYHRLGKALHLITIKRKVLPQSNLGKAIHYTLGQWGKLSGCFTDGQVEIDNNLIENGIRPTKLGAKNWLFMGSEAAGQSNAIWYTLIESCRRRRLDPWKYLVWIFGELPKEKVTANTFASYTPKAYAAHLKEQTREQKQAS